MDNNAAEQAIRCLCIGKKKWIMIDTVSGAKASAIAYSIAETAKANNLKPFEYFKYLLTVIPSIWTIQIEALWINYFLGQMNFQANVEN